MNLFCTSSCPIQSAQALDNARVNNQARETAQLLSTAVRLIAPDLFPDDKTLYRKAHEAHPISLWVKRSRQSFTWTLTHGLALLDEFATRFPDSPTKGIHASSRVIHPIMGAFRYGVLPLLPDCPQEQLPNCAANSGLGLNFKTMDNAVEAYRTYLLTRWQLAARSPAKPRWTNRQPPEWAMAQLYPRTRKLLPC